MIEGSTGAPSATRPTLEVFDATAIESDAGDAGDATASAGPGGTEGATAAVDYAPFLAWYFSPDTYDATTPEPWVSSTLADASPAAGPTRQTATPAPQALLIEFETEGTAGLFLDATTPPTADEAVDREKLQLALEKAGVDLTDLTPAQVSQAISGAALLRDGDTAQKIDGLAKLAQVIPLKDMAEVAKVLGVNDSVALTLASDSKALKAVATLSDARAKSTDKVAAAFTLAESLGKTAPKETQAALSRYLAVAPAGSSLAKAIGTWMDPEASGIDKAQATLDVAQAAQTFSGRAFPQLANALRETDSLSASVGAAITLLDPDASLNDKAHAAFDLATSLPEVKSDLTRLRAALRAYGVSQADSIVDGAESLTVVAGLPEAMRAAIRPEVASALSKEQAAQLEKLAADESLQKPLTTLLGNLEDPKAAGQLLDSLASTTDAATQKTIIEALGGMRVGVADKILTTSFEGKPAAEVLIEMAGKLDAKGQGKLVKLVSELGDREAGLLLRLMEKDTSGLVGKLLSASEKIDSKLAGRVLGLIDSIVTRTGIELTEKVVTRLLSGVEKILPIAGAVPAAQSAIEMANIANNRELPPAIRFMALQATKLNAADGVLSVAEPFIAEFAGLPVVADIGIAGVELAMDLLIQDQIGKAQAQGKSFQAPAWMESMNVAMALSQGPQGIGEMVRFYGADGTIHAMGVATRFSARMATQAVEAAANHQADTVAADAHRAAQSLHRMADIIRNPEKYGRSAAQLAQAAAEELTDLARGANDLAQAARKEVTALVGDLADMGVKGVKALGWLASHPGQAAATAATALGQLAERGVQMGQEAGRALARESLEALAHACDTLRASGQTASRAYHAATEAIGDVADAAVRVGQAGVETLQWIAQHPGSAARLAVQALEDVASQAGTYATQAFDALVGLGQRGVAAARRVVGRLQDAGEAGVKMLEYAAQHPGEALSAVRQAAGEELSQIARGIGREAEQATQAVLRLVDLGVHEIKDTASVLFSESEAALKRAAAHWKDSLSTGAKEVIDGLKDLGDAGRDALVSLGKWEIDAAKDAWHALENVGGKLWDWAT